MTAYRKQFIKPERLINIFAAEEERASREALKQLPTKRLNQLVLGRLLQLLTDGSEMDKYLIQELQDRVDGTNYAQYYSRGEGD